MISLVSTHKKREKHGVINDFVGLHQNCLQSPSVEYPIRFFLEVDVFMCNKVKSFDLH